MSNLPAPLPARPELRVLAGRTISLLEQHGKSPATKRSYRTAWAAFVAWCDAHGRRALPATPETVADYLAARASPDGSAAALRPSTLSKHLAAISKAHQLAGAESPARTGLVRETMQALRRRDGTAAAKKAPATTDIVRRMTASLPSSPKGTRDRALLLLGFATACRRGELAALDLEDVEEVAEGLVVHLRRSKTDQEGRGRLVGVCYGSRPETCPVRAVRAWRALLDAEAGPLFRSVTRHGQVTERRLSGRDVARAVKAAAEAAGLDPARFAGHSLRSGHATSAAAAGVEERVIAEQTGHRSVEVLRGYIRAGTVFSANSSAALGL